MRFLKCERLPFEWTSRKGKAAERRLRLERESLPLFAEQIAATQPSLHEIRDHRERAWVEAEREWRDDRARKWRAVRQRYFALPEEVRRAVLEEWNRRVMLPADPWYLHCVIQKHEAATTSKG